MGTTSFEDNLLYFPVDGLTKQALVKLGRKKVTVNQKEIALFAHKGLVYAIQDSCPHQGGPLHDADIEELPDRTLCVKCPWHSWKFSLTTGSCVFPSRKDRNAKVYPVKVEKDKILVGFDQFAPKVFSTPPE